MPYVSFCSEATAGDASPNFWGNLLFVLMTMGFYVAVSSFLYLRTHPISHSFPFYKQIQFPEYKKQKFVVMVTRSSCMQTSDCLLFSVVLLRLPSQVYRNPKLCIGIYWCSQVHSEFVWYVSWNTTFHFSTLEVTEFKLTFSVIFQNHSPLMYNEDIWNSETLNFFVRKRSKTLANSPGCIFVCYIGSRTINLLCFLSCSFPGLHFLEW
jgi:hypothetical protein